jgi:DNA polymerase/3'-5' exonuclease PolX
MRPTGTAAGAARAGRAPAGRQARAPGGRGSAGSAEEAAQRLAAIIGHGHQGLVLARALAREGVRTRADLKKPAVLARLPRESQASVLYNPARHVPLATARQIADEVVRRFVFTPPGEGRPRHFEVITVGSIRRGAPRVKDMDFLVVPPAEYGPQASGILATAALAPPGPGDRVSLVDTYAVGERHRSTILSLAPRQGAGHGRPAYYRADFFLTAPEEKPYALYHYTGSSAYNIRTRRLAKLKGWKLNQYGLFDLKTGRRVPGTEKIRTERQLAAFLGVSYREPSNRER